MVPEWQHNDSMASQEFRSRPIAKLPCTMVMSTAIQFDGQLCAGRIEIQDVVSEGMLPAKFMACKIPVPQVSPKNAFRLRGLLSQQSSAIHKILVLTTSARSEKPFTHTPHLNPLPASGARRRSARHRPPFDPLRGYLLYRLD